MREKIGENLTYYMFFLKWRWSEDKELKLVCFVLREMIDSFFHVDLYPTQDYEGDGKWLILSSMVEGRLDLLLYASNKSNM